MPCNKPLQAYRDHAGGVVFYDKGGYAPLELPCGRCVGCRLERSRQWAVRCMHEAKMHERNCWVTLTYDPEHVPEGYSLRYRDYQLFMKRLIKKFGPVRFYMCGEYGELNRRPHYHACLFGIDFDDKVKCGEYEYSSETLDKIWKLGRCVIGELTFESAAYTARYIMKKITGEGADSHYTNLDLETGEVWKIEPEFCQMSRRPGIGASWIDKYHPEVYSYDRVISRGKPAKPPRYYDNRYKRLHDADRFDEIKAKRELDAHGRRPPLYAELERRREAEEVIRFASVNFSRRKL